MFVVPTHGIQTGTSSVVGSDATHISASCRCCRHTCHPSVINGPKHSLALRMLVRNCS
ncbi:hypothetical protein LINPERPRIM_LOCUS1550, partial [Linum perenne]